MTQLVDVFGITTSVPTYTYVDRAGLDGQFEHLLRADRHVVIYGTSKQGKTSLRRKQLHEQKCIVVPCKPEHKLEDLYKEIRRQFSAALSRLNRLQADRKIFPPVLAYNNVAKTVSLVDREFLFFRKHTKRPWPWQIEGYEAELAGADLFDK